MGRRRTRPARRPHAFASARAIGLSRPTKWKILDHSRIEITMNVDTHLIPHARQDAADKMDAFLGSSRS